MFPHLTVEGANDKTPVQIFHGESDPMIPWAIANLSFTPLKSLPKLRISSSPSLGHSIDEKGIETMSTFLQDVISKKI